MTGGRPGLARGGRSSGLAVYLALSRALAPLAPVLLRRRLARGKEVAERIGERLGRAGLPRPRGRLAWLHAASVGEAMSLLPLVEALRRADPALAVLVTTGTRTSAERLAPLLPEGALHQFVPVDTAPAVRRFLDHWRPDLAVWVESEFWPRLMWETGRRGIPMMLANARMSGRSAARWRLAPRMAARLLGLFGAVATQDEATRDRLVALGVPPERVRVAGNLKTLLPPPGCDAGELEALSARLAGRPVWLAASTHAPEEEVALEAQRRLAASHPEALLILAPRHPERGDALERWLAEEGIATARRSTGGLPEPATRVWIADTMGEMGLWYRLAPVAFVGGSIAPMGGHNPFEPGALGAAVLHGPRVENFAPAYAALAGAGAAVEVRDGEDLAGAIARLLLPSGGGTAEALRVAASARAVLAEARPDAGRIAGEALALMHGGAS